MKDKELETNERERELEELSDGSGRRQQIEMTEEACNTSFNMTNYKRPLC